jgi:hypothetical protein
MTMLLRRLWTAEEEESLREWATKISVNRIAIRLKRSPSAVKSRALELGLSLSTRDRAQNRPSSHEGPPA